MKLGILFVWTLFLNSYLFSQTILWEKSMGGSKWDTGYSLFKDANGKIIILGSSASNDHDVNGLHPGLSLSDDFWLIHLDSAGNLTNQRCIGGSNGDEGRRMIRTIDGGYLLLGIAASSDGDVTGSGTVRQQDFWLAKTDSSFNIEWGKLIGGGLSDIPSSVIQTSDSGFMVVGTSDNFGGYVQVHYGSSNYSDIFVAKVSKNGVFEWGKTLGGSFDDKGADVFQTNDGGFIVLGSSDSRDYDMPATSTRGVAIFKLDSIGNIQFVKTHGGTNGELTTQLIKEENGNFLVLASTGSSDGDVVGYMGYVDVWVLKVDSLGEIIWQKCLGSHGWEEATCVIKTNDGGYLIGATSFWGDSIINNYSVHEDCWLVKIDSLGNYQWSKIFGGTLDDNVHSILQLSEHEYIFTGSTRSFDYDVSSCYGSPNCYEDVWVVKFADGINTREEITNPLTDLKAIYLYNEISVRFINKNFEKISIRLIDLMGKIVFSKSIDCLKGLNYFSFPLNVRNGVYILEIRNADSKQTVKIVVN